MKYKWIAVIMVAASAVVLIADWPTGGGYELRWNAITNGGTETELRESVTGYRVADNLGNASHVTDSFLTDGTFYINRPGYRKVEWDERAPFTSVNDLGADTISSAPNFPISWGGADTTIEDGIGWGIRYYDVQYRRNAGGSWEDWHVRTTLTSDIFGPLSPDTVFEDTTYYFRCRGYDLVDNIEDWPVGPPDWQAWGRYEEQVLTWVVVNLADSNDWTIADSVPLNFTKTMEAADVFIIKNQGTAAIDMGIKGYSATGWALEPNPGDDQYALRAYFDDNATPPVTFTINDAVYDTGFTWATGTIFGPGGTDIQDATADSTSRTENLWLQLKTPTAVSSWIDSQAIRLDLKAKASSP
ncbi:hypothetical protein DRQ36_04210 [bacterium]|nr:MAG: hypothetical protein DRQ36_04210 [bacterium]